MVTRSCTRWYKTFGVFSPQTTTNHRFLEDFNDIDTKELERKIREGRAEKSKNENVKQIERHQEEGG